MLAPNANGGDITHFEDRTIYAVASDRELLIEALDERRRELSMSMNELDDIAGLAMGATGKYFGPSRVKTLGLHVFLKMIGALGLRLVLEVDGEATDYVLTCRRETVARHAHPGNFAQPLSARVVERVAFFLERDVKRGKQRAEALRRWFQPRERKSDKA
jgi:hypothetical protein